MNSIEHSIVIQRPVADVFAYVNDYNNDTKWRGGVRLMTQSTPTVQVGTETHEIMHFMGSDYDTLARIIEFAPNSKVVFKSTKARVPVEGWRWVEAAEGGTRLTMHTELTVTGLMGLFAPFLVSAFARQMRADLVTVKRLLEA